MDVILESIEWQFALVYLDFIIIFPKTYKEYIDNGKSMLTLLQRARFTFKLEKWSFFTEIFDIAETTQKN